ncbi:MAG: hypothetical protein RhofKO_07110 [Rhodothermales bacterium]
MEVASGLVADSKDSIYYNAFWQLPSKDVITFQGRSVDEIETAFREAIEDYLEFCAERGEKPDRPFSGRLMVRLPKELHRAVHVEAKRAGMSLNQYVVKRLSGAR